MGVVDIAGKTAIAVSLEFSIPVFRGEPNLDADVAVCGGSSLDHDAAKSRKRFKNSCAVGKKRRQFDWQFEGAALRIFACGKESLERDSQDWALANVVHVAARKEAAKILFMYRSWTTSEMRPQRAKT